MNELILDGCTPEPLMGYLKALGVLRLVSEQKDGEALGYWRDGAFVLQTTLGPDGLAAFFRGEYKPTPIVSPWNGGSGFYRTWDDKKKAFRNRDAVNQVEFIEQSSLPRLKQYQSVIRTVKEALNGYAHEINVREMSKADRNSTLLMSETRGILDTQYDRLLPFLRSRLPNDVLKWFDTVIVLQGGEKRAPLLISGGNDGNFDFSVTFMDFLQQAFSTSEKSTGWLRASLFSAAVPHALSGTAGHLYPGSYDGPNSSVGFSGGGGVNPWDFVLMIEGAVLLAGAVSRRQGAGSTDRAIFPFTVTPSAVGYGSAADMDETSDGSRAEVWVPLWDQPTACAEIVHLFAEGRSQIGRRQARTGIEFAQALAGLGVSRGITAFTRFGFLRRFGKMFLAAPLGHFAVTPHPKIDLLDDPKLREWEEGMRRACRDKDKTPARYLSVLRSLDQATFNFATRLQTDKASERSAILDILRLLGRAEKVISASSGFRSKNFLKPLGMLSAEWLTAANDGSPEFSLARGVAYLKLGIKGTGCVRRYLEPVERNRSFLAWGETGGHVVWNAGDLARNLGAVLIRRLLDTEKCGDQMLTLGSPFPVSLADIAAFLHRGVDDAKLEDLLWGLSLIGVDVHQEIPDQISDVAELPRAYALLKLTLLSGRLEWANVHHHDPVLRINAPQLGDTPGGVAVKPEPAILAKLRAGDVQGACEVAARRLQSSGFSPIGAFLADGTRRNIDWSAGGVKPERLLAALLFPIPGQTVNQLADLVLRRPSVESLV